MGAPPRGERPIHVGNIEMSCETLISEVRQEMLPRMLVSMNGRLFVQEHANQLLITTIGEQERLGILVARSGCDCGCGAPGKALAFTATPGELRSFATALIAEVEQAEAIAAQQAAAAIARAKGGPA